MNCTNCNTMLAPGSGFCGACGQPQQPQQPQQGYPQQGHPPPGYPPPQGFAPPGGPLDGHAQPQQGYPQQGHPQQGYPQQGPPPGFPQPGYPQQGPQQGPPQGPPGSPQAMQPYPQQGMPQPGLRPFPIIMQQRFTRLTGQMFLAPTRLFFICESQKGGIGVAIGHGLGGIVGGVIAAMAAPTPGQAAPVIDEPMLFQAAQQMAGSMVMEPPQFKAIKHTMWTRGIFYGGKTYALPSGLDKELRQELGMWCQANGVKQAGLIK